MRSVIVMAVVAVVAAGAGVVAACGPIRTENTVRIEQPKPLEVNVNLSGRLELVITDARQDLEQITGEAPKQQVSPADIGLPADTVAPTSAPASMVPVETDTPVATLSEFSGVRGPGMMPVAASEDSLIASMKARNAAVRELWVGKLVGEAHTGMLVERGKLSAQQAATVKAENADRQALYELRAAKSQTTVDKAALAYYLQRLGYAEKGEWIEKFNKSANAWEWKQWGE